MKLVLLSGVEYVYLVLLWMAFVSRPDKTEFQVGLIIALIGTVADVIVKAEGLGHFRPRIWWILLSFLEPWYVLKGTWTVFRYFRRALRARIGLFRTLEFEAGEDDIESGTRRAAAVMLLTMPPSSVVIGIDNEAGKLMVHELVPESPSVMARELGVQE